MHLMFFFQYYWVSQNFLGTPCIFKIKSNFSIAVARERRKERGRKWQRGIRRLGQISTRNRWNLISLLKIFFTHFLSAGTRRESADKESTEYAEIKPQQWEWIFVQLNNIWYLPSKLQHSMFFNNFCPKIVIYASCVHNISHSYQRCQ